MFSDITSTAIMLQVSPPVATINAIIIRQGRVYVKSIVRIISMRFLHDVLLIIAQVIGFTGVVYGSYIDALSVGGG